MSTLTYNNTPDIAILVQHCLTAIRMKLLSLKNNVIGQVKQSLAEMTGNSGKLLS